MDARQYQLEAARTLISKPGFEIPGIDIMLIWCSVGLSGESGEVAEIIKKGIFHQHGIDNEKLFKEIGDCLWYLAGLCTIMGIDMGEVMQANIDKLKVRYPNGFNSQDSISRKDVNNGNKQSTSSNRPSVLDIETCISGWEGEGFEETAKSARVALARLCIIERALERIANKGIVFDAKGTWSQEVNKIANTALSESE